MSKTGGPPKGKPWVWMTRDLLVSEAWRSMAINTRRLIDFLMIEHMGKAGRENGRLLAPRNQLVAFGIGARHVSAAIEDAVALGLVDVKRGSARRANLYALTWLPLPDGTMPEPRWLAVAASEGKSLPMTSEGIPLGYPKGSHKPRNDFRREVINPPNDFPSEVSEGKHLYRRRSYQGSSYSMVLDEQDARASEAVAPIEPMNRAAMTEERIGKGAAAGEHGNGSRGA